MNYAKTHEKEADAAIQISANIDLKVRNIVKDKEALFIMI